MKDETKDEFMIKAYSPMGEWVYLERYDERKGDFGAWSQDRLCAERFPTEHAVHLALCELRFVHDNDDRSRPFGDATIFRAVRVRVKRAEVRQTPVGISSETAAGAMEAEVRCKCGKSSKMDI